MNEERETQNREREKKRQENNNTHVSVFCERTNIHKKEKENHKVKKGEKRKTSSLISDDDAETLFTQKNISHKKI